MARGSGRGRVSYRDTLLANKRSLDMYADLSGKPRMQIDIPPERIVAKRVHRLADDGKVSAPLESEILRAVMQFLRAHPKVAKAIRINSGAMESIDAHGEKRFTRFNSEHGISDIVGMMIGGTFFSLEIKRPPFAGPRNSREATQAQFLGDIRAGGGRAGFATGIDDARRILGI